MPHTLLTPRIFFAGLTQAALCDRRLTQGAQGKSYFESFCKTTRRSALLAGLALALAACGGSPSGETVIPSTFDVAQLQGRWVTGTGVTPGYTTLILPPQAGSATAWVLAQDAGSLTRLSLAGGAALSVSGKSYSLTGAALGQPVSTGASAAANLTAVPKTLTFSNLSASTSPIALSLSDGLTGAPPQADVSGNWSASAGNGAQEVNWSLNASGTISGSSTTGCVWSGTLLARVDARLYNASMTENCAGTINQFSGVATVNADKSRLTVVGTLIDESRALVLLFAHRS